MKRFLVTGGSRGLGLAICRQLLDDGHRLIVVNRTLSRELQELQRGSGGRVTFIEYDLENDRDIHDSVFRKGIGSDVRLDGYVNNAAIAYDDLVTNLNVDSLEKMFRVNVFSAMVFTKYAIRNMLLHRVAGSLVHISSISVHTGYKGLAMYASTKGALEAFSKNTAREWGSRGIRSNCVVAGFMPTQMSAGLSEDQKNRIYRRTALGQATSPESVAATTAFLLSEASGSVTGQNMFVDCGTI